jgi:hypothetical protein
LDIYAPVAQDRCPCVLTVPPGSRVLKGLAGRRQLPGWVPPPVTLQRKVRGRFCRPVDMPWLHGYALVLTAPAREALESALADDVEYLPLACDDAELWLVNALNVVDALDDEKSVAVRFPNGRIMDITSPVFRAELIEGRRCFAIPQVSTMFLAESVVDAALRAGLTGASFRRVWSSATPQEPLDPEGTWRHWATMWQWNVAAAVAPPVASAGGSNDVWPYDEAALCARLSELEPWRRTVFAASCAERLLPAHETWGAAHPESPQPASLREILGRVWDGVYADEPPPEDVLAMADTAGWALPAEPGTADEDLGHWVALGENAALAVACVLQTWATGDPVVAAWAARQAYEAVEQSALVRRDHVPFDHQGWETLTEDRLVQAELRRQNQDLEELSKTPRHDPLLIEEIRGYATMDTKAFLGLDASTPDRPPLQPPDEAAEPPFRAFLMANPPSLELTRPIDGARLARQAQEQFRTPIPDELAAFWSIAGSGVFGSGELYVFGEAESDLPGPEFLSWNARPEWRRIYPPPAFGGPLFFAQTSFGNQLGFRWEDGVAVPILFLTDTVETFRVAADMMEMFAEVLGSSELDDPEKSARARAQLGLVPPGEHYVPDLSPLLGGTGESFHVEGAAVHLAAAIAQWDAIRKLPPGTKVTKSEADGK